MYANTLCWRPGEKLSRERATNGRNIITSAKNSPLIQKPTNLKSTLFKALKWLLTASGTGLTYQAQMRG